MSAIAIPLSTLATSSSWQANFLAVLPAVQNHADVSFRHLHSEAKAEATAHAIAAACVNYHTLARQHKLDQVYAGSVASYAVKSVNSGRPVGGRMNSKDVMNPLAQRHRNIAVRSLNPWIRLEGNWRDMVLESRRASPAEQACFNVDFQEWMRQWPDRHRRIINALASGEKTMAVAARFGTSQARVSQLRREYERSWQIFQGMPQAEAA